MDELLKKITGAPRVEFINTPEGFTEAAERSLESAEKVIYYLGRAEILMDAYGADSVCVVAYCVSQPDEKIISAPLKDLAQTVKVEKITRSALIIVGKVLDIDHTRLKHRSKLYQKGFKHGYRK